MRGFIGLTKRNMMLYFKDVPAVIFSLLTSIIVFVLYIIFLKDTFVNTITSAATGLESFIASEDLDMLVSLILLVGILGSAMITVPYSCLSTVIKDRENKIDYDILATPIKRGYVILSYFTAAVFSAFLVTSVILTIGLVFLKMSGELYMSAGAVAGTYLSVLLGSVSATAIFMIIALFFKTSASSSAFFGILSAACGFVIGAYIPLSQFSDHIQTVCYLAPATQVTVLLRNNLMNGILDHINEGIGGVDQGAFADAMRRIFNFSVTVFEKELSREQSILYVLGILVCSLVILVCVYTKTYKRK